MSHFLKHTLLKKNIHTEKYHNLNSPNKIALELIEFLIYLNINYILY
jgi:hypothetical protein